MQTLALTAELAFANLLLDRVQRPDLFERFADAVRIGRLGFEEGSPRMRLIWCSR